MMKNGSYVILRLNNFVKELQDANHFAIFVIENVRENSIQSLMKDTIIVILLVILELLLKVVKSMWQIKKYTLFQEHVKTLDHKVMSLLMVMKKVGQIFQKTKCLIGKSIINFASKILIIKVLKKSGRWQDNYIVFRMILRRMIGELLFQFQMNQDIWIISDGKKQLKELKILQNTLKKIFKLHKKLTQ